MFKLPTFRKAQAAVAQVMEPRQSTAEVIEEIHDTFYTEVDRLLENAMQEASLETNKQTLLDKCARLKALGFTNTKEVKEAEAEIKRLDDLKAENEKKAELIEAIRYFSFRYPNYKFITEESVGKICEKYGLVYGDISRYTGTVPYKNLKHIEDFKISEEDACYIHEERISGFSERARAISTNYITKSKCDLLIEDRGRTRAYLYASIFSRTILGECPLEIAAPRKDFNMEGMEVQGFKVSKVEIPDPIVLKPVIFKGAKHYLVITAWGLEAADELVVNEIHN